MKQDAFNAFCATLPAATFVEQWGGAQVWKVGGKMFAIGGFGRGKFAGVSFKVSDIAWEILRDADGCRPAPYLAPHGLKWIQTDIDGGLKLAELKQYLRASHALVAAGLSRKSGRSWAYRSPRFGTLARLRLIPQGLERCYGG